MCTSPGFDKSMNYTLSIECNQYMAPRGNHLLAISHVTCKSRWGFEWTRKQELEVNNFTTTNLLESTAINDEAAKDNDSEIDCQIVDNTLRMIFFHNKEETQGAMLNENVDIDNDEEDQESSSYTTPTTTKKCRCPKRTPMHVDWSRWIPSRLSIPPRQMFGTVHMYCIQILKFPTFIKYSFYAFACHVHSSLN